MYFHVSELPGKRGERFIEDGTPVSFELGSWNGKTVGKSVRPMIDDAASETEVRDGRG